MRKTTQIRTMALALAAFFALFGSAPAAAAGRTVSGKIYDINVSPDGSLSFTVQPMAGGNFLQLCDSGGGGNNLRGSIKLNYNGTTSDGLKILHSTLMAAYLGGKKVTIYGADNTSGVGWGCYINTVVVNP